MTGPRRTSQYTEDHDISLARLKLVESAQVAFRRALDLMGISAPERM